MRRKEKVFAMICALLLCLAFAFVGCNGTDNDGANTAIYYTVTFDSNGGSAVESQRILSGNPATRPETPELDGYFLNGWYKDAQTSDEWHFDTDRVTFDLTLYAGWTQQEDLTPTASLVYMREENTYTVTGMDGEETQIVIPTEYDGLPVTKIAGEHQTGAFARKSITSVIIPDSVTEIGYNTFSNCTELVSVSITATSNLEVIGNNAFSGCHALEDFYLPEKCVTLGDSVFNNCGKINFTVASGNSAYRAENGHLIDNSADILIRGGQSGEIPDGVQTIAQAAFRRSENISELFIPKSVTTIGNYIIANSNVTSIAYQGTEAEWNEIEKGNLWNMGKTDIEIKFSQSYDEEPGILIAYFSRADENYGVGVVEKGNTQIVAEIIAEETGGTLFHIERATPYPASYSECTAEAQRERNASERPTLKETIDIGAYDVIYIGYPIWWSDMPMPVYTFLESQDWSGKTVYPFCTHAGSGLSGTVSTLKSKLTGATVSDGFAISGATAQNNYAQTQSVVREWLNK